MEAKSQKLAANDTASANATRTIRVSQGNWGHKMLLWMPPTYLGSEIAFTGLRYFHISVTFLHSRSAEGKVILASLKKKKN